MSTAPNVTIIPVKVQTAENRDKYHQLRVAAYCRVSTEQEEQQNSYQVQIAYYTDLINRKKGMDFGWNFRRRRNFRHSDEETYRVQQHDSYVQE